MVNLELKLFGTMLYTGDFSPLAQGDVTEDTCLLDQSKAICNYITSYSYSTNHAAKYPSLAIVQAAFPHITLPVPDPGDTVAALAHEVRLNRLRADIKTMATDLEVVSKMPNPLEELDKASAKLRKMSEPLRRSKHLSLKKTIQGFIAEYADGNVLPDGIPWPWPSLQKATRGQHRKEAYFFAGRPKSRKTFTASEVAVRDFIDQGERVLFFTPEMPPRQIMLRAIASMAKIRYTEFKNGELDEAEVSRLCEVAEMFGELDNEDDDAYTLRMSRALANRFPDKPCPTFDVLQSTGRDVAWMRTQIEIFRPSIVVCDSFYRQDSGGRKYDSDWKAIAGVSRLIKDMAMENNVVLIGTVQLNRDAESKIGSLANVALSDAIGQDGDIIFRVVTGKIGGEDRSALVVLGGRELPFDGLLINNKPCWDMNEIGPITNKKQVLDLMAKEDEEDEAQEGEPSQRRKMPSKAGEKARKIAESRLGGNDFGGATTEHDQ